MSRQGMERIIERALADESFRVTLFADPRRACAPFDITESEFVTLMGRTLPDFDGELPSGLSLRVEDSRTETPNYRRQGFADQAHA